MKNHIDIKHHCEDYECMWNGIEDLYMEKTNEKLPYKFFFILSGSNSFCYLKTDKQELKRMIAFGDGRTRKMYEFLAPKVGFDYKFYEKKDFTTALKSIKKEIDQGYPVIIGALDMYYLPHFKKIYHIEHIPFHYEMVVGYDDEKKVINVIDCGREEEIDLSYQELEYAWNCQYKGLSKPFTLITIRFNSLVNNKYEIARLALKEKVNNFLHPQCKILGYLGFEKFIKELPSLKSKFTKMDYDALLINLITFFGDVPTVPNIIKGINENDTINFYGGFNILEDVLVRLGRENNNPTWISAGNCFGKNSEKIEKIKNLVCDYIVNDNDCINELVETFQSILNTMIEANKILEKDLIN